MGKYSLVITLGVMSVVSLIALQGQQMSMDTQDRQSRREGQVIARQIARSGHNAVLAEARAETDPGDDVSSIVSDVGTITGDYEGGNYRAWLEKISPTAFKAVSEGKKIVADRVVKHELGDNYADNHMVKVPTVNAPSTLNLQFIESMAGYCSAVYLQRILPNTEPEDQPDPEMIFAPNNRRAQDEDRESTATYDETIQTGTKLNFILAVDKNCSERGDTSADYPEDYDHTQLSFSQDSENLNKVREAPFGMVEETTFAGTNGWRVSFEDQRVFNESQLWDVKDNGYPDHTGWNSDEETYGGDGWDKNAADLRELRDFGNIPDFSDQVFRVGLSSPGGDSEEGAESGEIADK